MCICINFFYMGHNLLDYNIYITTTRLENQLQSVNFISLGTSVFCKIIQGKISLLCCMLLVEL